MVAIKFELLSHFHATPWNRHVNEGEVEWPPSPWRILRALIATGFNKLGWEEGKIPAEAVLLIESLAAIQPSYRLPDSSTRGHSRHFQPQFKAGKSAKAIDAFLVARGGWIGVLWDTELEAGPRALLADLVARISYLGRSESWVSGCLVESAEVDPEEFTVAPLRSDDHANEAVQLLSLVQPTRYLEWRAKESTADLDRLGKKPTKAQAAKIERRYPKTILQCLLGDTRWLRTEKWSRPPGTNFVSYVDRSAPTERIHSVSRLLLASGRGPGVAIYALSSETRKRDVLPPMSAMLTYTQALHGALVKKLGDEEVVRRCPSITGKDRDGKPLAGHRHAHILPLDLDCDGKLDHLVVYTGLENGFQREEEAAISLVSRLFSRELKKPLYLTLTGLGVAADFDLPLFTKSRKWVSATPFVPSRHLRRNYGLAENLHAEVGYRSLPASLSSFDSEAAFRGFQLRRTSGKPQPPSPRAFRVELEFDDEVSGPVALGYGSHYGLGLFLPPDAL